MSAIHIYFKFDKTAVQEIRILSQHCCLDTSKHKDTPIINFTRALESFKYKELIVYPDNKPQKRAPRGKSFHSLQLAKTNSPYRTPCRTSCLVHPITLIQLLCNDHFCLSLCYYLFVFFLMLLLC